MADPAIKIELDKFESKELESYLNAMRDNNTDPRPFFQVAMGIISNSAIENFRSQGRPRRWLPLAESTIEGRLRKKTWPGNILEEYGTLKQSMLPGSRGSYKRLTKSELEFGTKLRKAPALQFGHTFRGFTSTVGASSLIMDRGAISLNSSGITGAYSGIRVLPPRPFLFFQEQDMKQIMAYAFLFAFQPNIAKRYGNSPTVHSIPKKLFVGAG